MSMNMRNIFRRRNTITQPSKSSKSAFNVTPGETSPCVTAAEEAPLLECPRTRRDISSLDSLHSERTCDWVNQPLSPSHNMLPSVGFEKPPKNSSGTRHTLMVPPETLTTTRIKALPSNPPRALPEPNPDAPIPPANKLVHTPSREAAVTARLASCKPPPFPPAEDPSVPASVAMYRRAKYAASVVIERMIEAAAATEITSAASAGTLPPEVPFESVQAIESRREELQRRFTEFYINHPEEIDSLIAREFSSFSLYGGFASDTVPSSSEEEIIVWQNRARVFIEELEDDVTVLTHANEAVEARASRLETEVIEARDKEKRALIGFICTVCIERCEPSKLSD
ncbi:hypothetical protein DL93DRAFT_1606441 [Clavulina sp. PMI_390]|nr:hypothetical protein DL93DRAFT_1606441 [Clavulina sp. PMI_390]